MPECQLSREYVVDIGQTDCRGLARPSAIVDFMQDIATRHAEIMGIGGEALKQHHGFWVLSRLKYQLERPLQPYETVRLTTLPRKLRGASWYRDFVFEDAGGVPYLAHTVSSAGSYLAKEAGVREGSALAYLIAPPLEAMYAMDAALKAADVKLCKLYAPPSETNFGGGLLSGTQSACDAACAAFAQTVAEVAAQPK